MAVPAVPEIRLHKAGPKSGIWRLAEIEGVEFLPPFWTSWWGGGAALARHILDHPEIVARRRVLDLGAGSGLVGIAAAKAGAKGVIAADIDPLAVAVTLMNAAENGVELVAQVGDFTSGDPPDVDVILVGDLFYDRELAMRTTAFLDRCVARRIDVFVGDPGRAYLPHAKLRLIAEYDGADFGTSVGARSSVFEFTGRSDPEQT
jgi:predicted nicotinamide N-methyase